MREKIVADFRFIILNPSDRPVFRIYKNPGSVVKDPRLNAINTQFKTKKLNFEDARKQVEELRDVLYREAKAVRAIVYNSDNERLKSQYWEKEYSHRELVDPKTAEYELDRAIACLGQISIYTASQSEIQKAADQFKGNRQRRIVAALRRLLAFAGRNDVRLRKVKKEKKTVPTLSEKDFKEAVKKLRLDSHQTMAEVAFYTGARIGEMFAMESEHFNDTALELRIFGQVDKSGTHRETKNRKERTTLVFPQGVKALKEWFKIKSEIDPKIRNHMAEIFKEACIQTFPKEPKRWLVFHDLRHCYARMIREAGLTTEDVADLIGDSLIVAKEHYSNFGPTAPIMELRRKAIKRKKTA